MKHYIIVKFRENTDVDGMLPEITELFEKALALRCARVHGAGIRLRDL